MNITPNARIIFEKTCIQGNVKRSRAYIRRKRIAQTVATDASHVTEKLMSETVWRSITDAVYLARYQSQCWFISYSLHSTCETRYGRQLGRAKPDLGSLAHSPAHHLLKDPRTRNAVAENSEIGLRISGGSL